MRAIRFLRPTSEQQSVIEAAAIASDGIGSGLLNALLNLIPTPPARTPVKVEDWEIQDLLPQHQINEILRGTRR